MQLQCIIVIITTILVLKWPISQAKNPERSPTEPLRIGGVAHFTGKNDVLPNVQLTVLVITAIKITAKQTKVA